MAGAVRGGGTLDGTGGVGFGCGVSKDGAEL
ncbi:hypothetical protein CCP3SC1AL1_770006 [Gammaproteobacteria bacterium]